LRLPPEFDLHALEVFVLTVELGGMTASAQQLRVTQSAVSQTITRLESGMGTPLFDRALRPLGLTPAGRALYQRAKRLLATARTMYDEVREGAQQPIDQIIIGLPGFVDHCLLQIRILVGGVDDGQNLLVARRFTRKRGRILQHGRQLIEYLFRRHPFGFGVALRLRREFWQFRPVASLHLPVKIREWIELDTVDDVSEIRP